MKYKGTLITDALSVTEIYAVLRPNLAEVRPGDGERHPFSEIIYLAEGEHILLIDQKEYALHAGQMIVYAPNAYHDTSARSTDAATAYILSFNAVSRIIMLTPRQRQTLSDIITVGCEIFATDRRRTRRSVCAPRRGRNRTRCGD